MNRGITGVSHNHPTWCALRLRRRDVRPGRSAPNSRCIDCGCGPRHCRPFCFYDRRGPRRGGRFRDLHRLAGRLVRRFTGGHFGNGLRCSRLHLRHLRCCRIVYDRCRRRPVGCQSRIRNAARLKQAVNAKPEKAARQYADGKMQRESHPGLLAVRILRAHDAPGTEPGLDWFLLALRVLRRSTANPPLRWRAREHVDGRV
jgi:hypothetical protein